MPRIIILGTGTDVGKTYVSTQLAHALQVQSPGSLVTAIKPVESGTGRVSFWDGLNDPLQPSSMQSGQPASDAEALACASSPPLFVAHHAYQFADPISPHLAARRSKCAIDPERIAAWVRACAHSRERQYPNCNGRHHWLLIETAGATHSPLARGFINADLAALLEPALWLLVAPDRIGVLHDVTTTLNALRAAHRPPDLLLLSQPPVHDRSTGTNGPELGLLGIAEIDGVVSSHGPVPASVVDRLSELAHARQLL